MVILRALRTLPFLSTVVLAVACDAFGQGTPRRPVQVALDSIAHTVTDPSESAFAEEEADAATERAGMRSGPRALAELTWTTIFHPDRGRKIRTRFDGSIGSFEVRFDAEHDPGEPWTLDPGSGAWGFDHVGAYVSWAPSDRVTAVIGDYRVSTGYGLVTSAPRLGRLIDDVVGASRSGSIRPDERPVRPYSGSDEDRYHSGAAISVAAGPLRASVFLSRRRLDAAIDTVRTPGGNPVTFARPRPGGEHSTDLGRSRRQAARLAMAGLTVRWSSSSDLEAVGIVFGERSVPDLDPATRTGTRIFGQRVSAGLSLRGGFDRLRFGAEWATVGRDRAAILFLAVRASPIEWIAGVRRYGPGYAPLQAAAPSFRSGVPGNERGATMAFRWRPRPGASSVLSADAACRILAEAEYALGGCRHSLRLDARWAERSIGVDGHAVLERLRKPDRTDARGGIESRTVLSGILSMPIHDRVAVTITAAARHTRPESVPLPVSALHDPQNGLWSTRVSLRARWETIRGITIDAGASDHHVMESVMGMYESTVPFMGSIRTLSGDGESIFATIRREGERADWGVTVRSRIKRTEPATTAGDRWERPEIGASLRFRTR